MKKVKIGVFGAGRGFALCESAPYFPDAELVAVCDSFKPLLDRMDEFAKEKGLNVTCYENFDDFIKHDMDAVILANYATEHAPFAVRCLDAGKHVMSENVPCETMAQAVELCEAVERTGLVYTYAENCCYMREPFEMWKKMKNGELGKMIYAEGEYVHDCAEGWPYNTHGDPDHWRNKCYATFYVTHSIGPLINMAQSRPVSVVAFETNGHPKSYQCAMPGGGNAGLEIVTLEDGTVIHSLHGGLKREPGGTNWRVYCEEGYMQSSFIDRGTGAGNVYSEYKENEHEVTVGEWKRYVPKMGFCDEIADKTGHGGSDFFVTYFFVKKILGEPEGEWAIDLYTALDMAFCGLLGWRSVLNGNTPVRIPNFRNPEEREAFRNDHACITPEIAGDQLLPSTTVKHPEVTAEIYKKVKDLFEAGLNGNGDTPERCEERREEMKVAFAQKFGKNNVDETKEA